MKNRSLFYITSCLFFLLFAGALPVWAQANWGKQYPVLAMGTNTKAGTLILKRGVFKNKNKRYKKYPKKITADYGVLAVPENREKENTRLIYLPVVRLRSWKTKPAEPVFLLAGGPGNSNIWSRPLVPLLQNHDIVMVGYRGVDGSTVLNSPEFRRALMAGKNVFGTEHLKQLAKAWDATCKRYKNEGIDLSGYTITNVVDDLELTRKALGYTKVNLYSASYGTRLAYLYGVKYENRVKYSFMQVANAPGGFVWEPEVLDQTFSYLGEQWKKNPENVKRSPDIIQTIKETMNTLPQKWRKTPMDEGKIRLAVFHLMYRRNGVAQVFDAFADAARGNYRGLAFMVKMYDMLGKTGTVWGDFFIKAMTADYDTHRDYEKEMAMNKNTVIGAPMSQIFAVSKYSKTKLNLLPKKYRKMQVSKVKIVLLSGNIDVSSPVCRTTRMLEYLPNGKQIIWSDKSHQDIPKVYTQALGTFYLTGKISSKAFRHNPMSFSPAPSLSKMSKLYYTFKFFGLAKLVFGI